jgi:hypothetical protein
MVAVRLRRAAFMFATATNGTTVTVATGKFAETGYLLWAPFPVARRGASGPVFMARPAVQNRGRGSIRHRPPYAPDVGTTPSLAITRLDAKEFRLTGTEPSSRLAVQRPGATLQPGIQSLSNDFALVEEQADEVADWCLEQTDAESI